MHRMCDTFAAVAGTFLVFASPLLAQNEAENAPSLAPELKTVCEKIHADLSAHVEGNKPSTWEISAPSDTLKTTDDFLAKLAELNRSGNAQEYVRHGVAFLTRFAPTAKFPEILWRTAGFAEVYERSGAPVLRTKLAPFLTKLLERLPEDNEFYLEGRFLAATHHFHQREFVEEEDILKAILDRKELTRDFRFSAIERLGFNMEMRHRFDEARKRYLEAADFIDAFPAAADAHLRAIYLLLESGKQDEALDEIDKLRAVDRTKWAESPGAWQLERLLAHTSSRESAVAYWETTAGWWPLWVELRETLGFRPSEPDFRIPALPNQRALAQQLALAARGGDTALFVDSLDLVVRAQRWLPDYLNDFGSAASFLGVRLFRDSAKDLRDLVIAVCEEFQSPDEELQRRARLYLTLSYSDNGRHARALEVIDAFRESDDKPDDAISQGMTRLWASIAYKEGDGMDAPAAALEKMLDDPKSINRAQTVLSLASLYRKMGRAEDELELLKKEIDHPAMKADEDGSRLLARRYAPLLREDKDAANFSVAVQDFLREHKPAWFDRCPPKSLEDPRIRDLEKTLQDTSGRFTDEERIRIRLLAADSDSLLHGIKEQAFRMALTDLTDDAPTHEKLREMLTSVIENDLFPEQLRQIVHLYALREAVDGGRKGDIAFYLTHDALDRNNERIRSALAVYGPYSQCDLHSPDELFAFYRKLADAEIGVPQLELISEVFRRLLLMGDLEKAEALRKDVDSWELGAHVPQSRATLKLFFLRALKQARRSIPFSEAMLAVARDTFDLDAVEEPDAYSSLRDLENLDALTRSEAETLRLWQIKTGQFQKVDPRFWIDFCESLKQSEKSFEFGFAMLEKLLEEADGDLEKSLSALSAPGFIDTDEPRLVERLNAIFKPWRKPDEYPLTYAAIRYFETQIALRLGEDIDLEQAFGDNQHPMLVNSIPRMKIRHYAKSGKKALLRTTLEALPADTLISPDMLALTIPALRVAGMEDEAELARETALESFPALVARAWRSRNIHDVREVYDIAIELDRPDLVPAEFYAGVSGHIRNEQLNALIRLAHFELTKNWPEMEKVATEAIAEFPTYYHYYWYQGAARYRLGRKQEALEPLTTYVKYSKDEKEYPTAAKWLGEIGSGKPEE